MSDDKKDDLTRLENLQEYLHEEDPNVDQQLSSASDLPSAPNLDFEEQDAGINDFRDDSDEFSESQPDTSNQDMDFDETPITSEDATGEFSVQFDSTQSFNLGDGDLSEEEFDVDAPTMPNMQFDQISVDSMEFDDQGDATGIFSPDQENPMAQSIANLDSEESEAPSFDSPSDEIPNLETEDLEEFTQSLKTTVGQIKAELDDIISDQNFKIPSPPPQEVSDQDSAQSGPFAEEPENDIPAIPDASDLETPEIPSDIDSFNFDQETSPASQAQDLAEINSFAEQNQYGEIPSEASPAFAVIIKDIQYQEDVDHIVQVLREHDLLDEQNEDVMIGSLRRGKLLLSQLSEFTAIYLANRLRKLDLEIIMGLADEIHPSETLMDNAKGIVGKRALFQNYSDNTDFTQSELDPENILVSTAMALPERQIRKFLGPVSHSIVIDELELQTTENNGEGLSNKKYEFLAEKLKELAIRKKGNAVLGIVYGLSPLGEDHESKIYHLTCTGNVCWVEKI